MNQLTNQLIRDSRKLMNELREMLNITPSVELFLSGEVVFSDINNNSGFESDIIVTNIDNFLSPSVKTTFADKLFLMNTADVVFDEYQELMTDEALLSAFINMIRVRHRYTKARTLLLSATPYVGLETFCKTKIEFQKQALMQPRASPPKRWGGRRGCSLQPN